MTARPRWFVPIGGRDATITIDEGLTPPAVRMELPEIPLGVMTSLEACQLGMTLQEASRVAAEMRVKQENRRRRG